MIAGQRLGPAVAGHLIGQDERRPIGQHIPSRLRGMTEDERADTHGAGSGRFVEETPLRRLQPQFQPIALRLVVRAMVMIPHGEVYVRRPYDASPRKPSADVAF